MKRKDFSKVKQKDTSSYQHEIIYTFIFSLFAIFLFLDEIISKDEGFSFRKVLHSFDLKQNWFLMNRFGDIDCSFQRLTPVYGFHSADIVSLEEALQPIKSEIKELSRYVKIAKQYCHYPNDQRLSKDQSASVYIYTMEWGTTSLYRVLNEALRSEDREALKIWFPYLKLFDTALDLLPTVKESVWRGIPFDTGKTFTKDQMFTWWAISSCKEYQYENRSTCIYV